jgi:cytochrome c peroxidase
VRHRACLFHYNRDIMKDKLLIIFVLGLLMSACSEDQPGVIDENQNFNENDGANNENNGTDQRLLLNGAIDLDNLLNYANQEIPEYINKDNTGSNTISNIEASLGRVLFYDTNLSSDNTVSCASCHQQEFAFSDPEVRSQGVNALTGRHSMRLVNARFAEEQRFFWDERADDLEQQTTMPIRDHGEMGFSGNSGDLDFDDLIERLSGIDYYNSLFQEAFGDQIITEERIQDALAQFIRSIQSFDSKYDEGRTQVNSENQNFPNFTALENMGKRLFMDGPQFQGPSGIRIGGGLGCNGCHNAPEFDIDENSRNNGVIGLAGDQTGIDLDVTRSPSLRDLISPGGVVNSAFMHTGEFSSLEEVLAHYNDIDIAPNNNNLDQRLARGGGVQLNMTQQEITAVVAFLETLTGSGVYTNEKWSNPFN